MEPWKRLLLENKAWAQDRASRPREAEEAERPSFLWIGASDARVPAQELTGAGPGELIVHRNVANLVVHTDASIAAVLELAVGKIGVEHVIVCGHHDCAGIRAAIDRQPAGRLDPWLAHVRDIWYAHKDELGMHDAETAERRLVELNVLQQVQNLARSEIVQRTWAEANYPTLHGWVFDHNTDLVTPLVKVDPGSMQLDDIFKFELTESES